MFIQKETNTIYYNSIFSLGSFLGLWLPASQAERVPKLWVDSLSCVNFERTCSQKAKNKHIRSGDSKSQSGQLSSSWNENLCDFFSRRRPFYVVVPFFLLSLTSCSWPRASQLVVSWVNGRKATGVVRVKTGRHTSWKISKALWDLNGFGVCFPLHSTWLSRVDLLFLNLSQLYISTQFCSEQISFHRQFAESGLSVWKGLSSWCRSKTHV